MKSFLKKHSKLLRNFLSVLLLVIVLISFLQVWYIGSFLDNIIFDFFFGSTRYFVYLLLFVGVIASFFKQKRVFYSKLISPRMLINYLVGINIVLMVISLVYYYLHLQHQNWSTNQYFLNYFCANWKILKATTFLWQMNSQQLANPGFFWLLFLVITKKEPIAFLWIILFASLILCATYFAYKAHLRLATRFICLGKKIKNLFHIKPKHNTKKQTILENEAAPQTATSEILQDISKTDIVPFSISLESNDQYLNYYVSEFSDLEEDHFADNKKDADKAINSIGEFFEKNNIDSSFLESEVGPSAIRIMFSLPKEKQIQWVTSRSVHSKLMRLLKVKSCFVYANNDRLRIELPLAQKGKISFKKTVENLIHNSRMSGLIGVNGRFDPIELSFNDSPITLINGDRQSGKENLIMQLVLSLLVRYSPNELIMVVIDNKNSLISRLDRVKNTAEGVASDLKSGINLMEKAIIEMKYRVKLLKDFHQSSIEKYNEKAAKKIANMLVIINDINDFIAYDAEYTFNFLKLVQKYAQKLNVFCLISTNMISEILASPDVKQIYKSVISLQTRTPEESSLLVQNSILYELFGDGDFYFIQGLDGSERPKVCRGQATYINNEIINQIIKKVNNSN